MISLPTFILSVFFSLFSAIHPVHVSVSDIELNRKDQELQIIVRIFTDDLELEIRREKNMPELDILEPVKSLKSEDLFAEYLNKHLKLKVNGSDRKLEYLGYEVEAGAVISYVLVREVAEIKEIEIMNDILLREFDDQVNLVHITIDGDISTMKFVRNQEISKRTF
jgi:hypothetical protein